MKNWSETWYAQIGVDEEHAEKLRRFLHSVIIPASMMDLKVDAYKFIKQKIEEYSLTHNDLAVIIVMLYNFIFEATEKFLIAKFKKEVQDEKDN